MPVSMTERTSLPSLFNDLLIVGTSLKTARQWGEPEKLRAQLLDMFYQANQAGGDIGIPKETLRLARYALAAFLDEMVMSSHWPQKQQWPSMSLQSELFSTDVAGQGFFQNLEEISRGYPLNTDLLELYYLCLVLGFEGKYKLQGREQLKALIQEMGRDIQAKRGEVPSLSLGETSRGVTNGEAQIGKIPWILGAGATALAIVLYVVLAINITWDAEAVKANLQAMAEKVR